MCSCACVCVCVIFLLNSNSRFIHFFKVLHYFVRASDDVSRYLVTWWDFAGREKTATPRHPWEDYRRKLSWFWKPQVKYPIVVSSILYGNPTAAQYAESVSTGFVNSSSPSMTRGLGSISSSWRYFQRS